MNLSDLSVHVATITRKSVIRSTAPTCSCHSFREDGRVQNRTVANLSMLPDAAVEVLRLALKGEVLAPAAEQVELAFVRPHGHVAAVVGTMRRVGRSTGFCHAQESEKDMRWRLVAGRVLHAGASCPCRGCWRKEPDPPRWGRCWVWKGADENELYAAMDGWVARQPRKIEDALRQKKHLTSTAVWWLYGRVRPSLHWKGSTAPLARFGYSRDHRKDRMQITYGLLCNSEGCPVAVEVFEGNTQRPPEPWRARCRS